MIRPDAGAGLFETVLVLGGRPVALEPHLRRLASSTSAVYGATLDVSPGGALEATVRSIVTELDGPHRLRVLVALAGSGRPGSGQPGAREAGSGQATAGQVVVELETEPAPSAFDGSLGPPITLVPSVIEGGLGPHKWRDRTILERRRAELGLDTSSHLLITDSDGTVLETERANVVALVEGTLVSPPPDGRLLAGVTVVLAFGIAARLGVPAAFRAVTLPDLETADEVFCTSAVRGLTPAGLLGRLPAGADRAAGTPSVGDGGGSIAARLGPALFESWRRC